MSPASPANAPDAERGAVDAARGGAGKRGYVQAMFRDIAPRYDLLNHLLSFNIDRGWRTAAIAALGVEREPAGRYLDLCAGTLDIAAEIARLRGFTGSVVAADFAEPMLRAGKAKAEGKSVHPVAADALSLPLPDRSVNGAIVGFGVRNLTDLGAGLREVHRVLRPGGRFVILEFTTPPSAVVRAGYSWYSNVILPRIGGWISGHRAAYRYLPESVAQFPAAPELASLLKHAGFRDVCYTLRTLGVVAIHVGSRR